MKLGALENLYRINENLYRSEQPKKSDFVILDSLGIKTVISLRNRIGDKSRAKKSNLTLKRVRINAWRMSYDDIVRALKAIEESEKPVLIHCLHGSDRTGAVVAAYRMVYEGWPKEKAIEEFLMEQYGYHEGWFPGILDLLRELDVEQLRKDLKN
ncbi:MAG: tyrosine-protein phosphatase [Brumimicrobium sp.]|nr:tyrosine-protein phosphatase [Brumimicrobium sp.]